MPLVPAFLSVLSCGSRRVGRIVALNRDGVGLQRIPPAVANGVSIRARRKEHDHQAVNDHLPNGTHERTLLSRGDFGRLGLAMIGASTVVDWVSQQSARADGETAVAGNGGDVSGAAMPAAAVAESRAVVPAPAREAVPLRDMGLEVSYTGKSLPLNKFLGSKATLVVNPKLDDPESLHQVRRRGENTIHPCLAEYNVSPHCNVTRCQPLREHFLLRPNRVAVVRQKLYRTLL